MPVDTFGIYIHTYQQMQGLPLLCFAIVAVDA